MWDIKYCIVLLLFSGTRFAESRGDTDFVNMVDYIVVKDWEYLIFTQHWPPTVCVDWEKKNPSHSCSMPVTPDSWTIHGVWPTKVGTIGPQFCNKTWLFDPEEVKPIEQQLENYWVNIEAGTGLYDLWAHEWNKHGTCAAQIEPLNSQIKYFSKGLEWLQQLSMSRILAESNIVPSDDKVYTLTDFSNAVKAQLNVEPQIECRSEKGGKQFLFEIRLCFTKALELVDCSIVNHCEVGASTNCLPNSGITYPATYFPPKRYLVQLYRLTNFLQWFTL